MATMHYAYVGSFHFAQSDKGLTAYRYEEQSGSFTLLGRYVTDVNLGQQSYDEKRKVIFAVDESSYLRAKDDGAGRVISLRLDPATGALEPIGSRKAASSLPSYVCLDATGRYAVVPHHCQNGHVTKLARLPDGSFQQYVEFDDAVVALFRVNDDGTIGELCDAVWRTGTGVPGVHVMSHLHSATCSPDGKLFLVCDTGNDRIAAYGLDAPSGKLIPRGETAVAPGCRPRYGVFHPAMPWFYSNNENRAVVHAFRYDSESGRLEEICIAPLAMALMHSNESPMVSDIRLHPNGRHLYIAARTANKIAMLDILPDGSLLPRQWIDCGGEGPRGLCPSPDGRFLFVANRDSDSIDAFTVAADGMLTHAGRRANANCPGNLQIITVKS